MAGAHSTGGVESWTFVDGRWAQGNVPLMSSMTHAVWQGSSVFDGARAFEGVAPDLDQHCQRVNASARALGLSPTMEPEAIEALAREGIKKFSGTVPLYIRPMYWAEWEGASAIAPDPASTRFALTIWEAPMSAPTGFSVTLSRFRKPSIECATTDAKAGCLYPNNGRALVEARSRGFDNAVMCDLLGNVAELATANIFLAKDGVVRTSAPNGTFLNGVTRQRSIRLMREAGITVEETALSWSDFLAADEVFSTGNYNKVMPITRVEDRVLQPGPNFRKARELYWAYAHG